MKEPRLYETEADLLAMQALVSEGTLARTSTHYLHPGDLAWWYGYLEPEADIHKNTYLWYGAHTLQGWALISPTYCTVDLFVRPFLLGSSEHSKMLDWITVKEVDQAEKQGKNRLSTIWIAQDDPVTGKLLSSRGFQPERESTAHLTREIDGELPAPILPAGFTIRSSKGLAEVEARALAQYRSFGSEWAMERYVERFRRFMQSSLYNPDLDLVVEAPDGRIAAFCILWEDRANKIGYIEPLGTDPEFQRKGLARAILAEGLLRMKADGMRKAWVSALMDEPAALSLYQSSGFQLERRLIEWACPVEKHAQRIEMPVMDMSDVS